MGINFEIDGSMTIFLVGCLLFTVASYWLKVEASQHRLVAMLFSQFVMHVII